MGHLKRNQLFLRCAFLREFRVKDPEVNEGDKVTVDVLCAFGENVDVIGTSKGKGFQGGCQTLPLQGRPQNPWSV